MMAGDVEWFSTSGAEDFGLNSSEPAIVATTSTPEGELAPDLVAFAKALDAADVTFFGAAWCPSCNSQKQLFGDGGQFLPFVEVTKADRTLNPIGVAEGISTFPTWEFPDGSRATGLLTLDQISQRSGVAIPQSDRPSFVGIGSQTVAIGSPLHIPVDAYNPSGGPISITVEVGNPALLDAVVLSGNRSIRMSVAGYGDMVFELFEDRAPRPAGRVIQLAEADFYDGLIFHRIIEGFVIQGGDPTGTGTGGSQLGTFDDQFHPELQHNRKGVLSYAKSSDDTNDSQFFITAGPTRNLDYNHSIFGQLVEGEKIRAAISKIGDPADKGTNSADKPLINIVLDSVSVFQDNQNAVVMLKPKGNQSGTTTVRFTATNADGETFSELVTVNVVADSGSGSNSQPYLQDITPLPSFVNTAPATLQLASIDVEGDAVEYFVSTTTTGVTATVNATTGLVTVTPSANFVGSAVVNVGVRPAAGVVGALSGQTDTQRLTFNFIADSTVAAPTSLTLSSASDSGASNSDRITNAGALTFNVNGVTSGAEVILFAGSTEIGRGVAQGTTIAITTANIAALGDGTYQVIARQRVGTQTSAASPTLTVIYDATPPVRVQNFPSAGNVGQTLSIDLAHPEEGSGLVYAIAQSPAGATINPQTGVFAWTPTSSQLGAQSVTLTLTDLSGNVRTETFSINIADVALGRVRLEVTDLEGNVIQRVQPNQEFLVRFHAADLRTPLSRSGVFAAFTDIRFDAAKVQTVGTNPITFGPNFGVVPSGTVGAGVIDELGAVSNSTVATNRAEDLIAVVRMRAIATGTAEFISDPADLDGKDFLLFGENAEIPAARLNYGRVSLEIGNRFVAANDSFPVVQGSGPATLDVLANDTFASGVTGTLTLSTLGTPSAGGTVSIQGNQVRYQHAANFAGTETFTYQVRDNTGLTQTATVSVTVTNPAANRPTAVNDTFPVVEDAAIAQFNVRSNDVAATPTSTISITAVGTPNKGGTVEIASGGEAIRYRPAANFFGAETVTYTITDSGGGTATATVTFNVSAVNDPPPASNIARELFRGQTNVVVATLADYGVNVDGSETLTVAIVGQSSAGGSFTREGTTIRYTPPNGTFVGSDVITYTTTDAGGLTSTGTLTVQVYDSLPTLYRMAVTTTGRPVAFASPVVATLTGTTTAGQAVQRTASLATSNQSLEFANLPAGNYQVQVPAMPFLIGMQQPQIQTFQAVPAGGTLSGTLNVGSLLPQYLRLEDFFSSASRDVLMAVVAPGDDSQATLGKERTTLVLDPIVALAANESSVTIRGNRTGANNTVSAVRVSVPTTDNRVQRRATEGGMRLMRINLRGLAFTETSTATTPAATAASQAATTPAAEGESALTNDSVLAAAQTLGMPSLDTETEEEEQPGLSVAAVDAYLTALGD